ncbi:Fic family protein [bacterium]|nr:Fic family protein [bacterium]
MSNMKKPYAPKPLPEAYGILDYSVFLDELIQAVSMFEVYKEKIKDSKVNPNWFMPTLQQKEAMKSSMMEGTQATLDGVLINKIVRDEDNKNLNEVDNYFTATQIGFHMLKRGDFSDDFFKIIHKQLMSGKVRKNENSVGEYRDHQNYVGKNDGTLVYIPPEPERVSQLMKDFIQYLNSPTDRIHPLIRVAIVHAQFETIHPFSDGNGRVGRILIPLYLYFQSQLELPYFFISEALERDQLKYYKMLNDTRLPEKWNDWIKFFLDIIAKQCKKYVQIISNVNELYSKHMEIACGLIKSSSSIVKIIDGIYQMPIFDARLLHEFTGIPLATINRYLNIMVERGLLFTDGKKRNRLYFYYDLLSLFRD